MHVWPIILVRADDEEDALRLAGETLNEFVDADAFDYYDLPETPAGNENCHAVCLAASAAGVDLINSLLLEQQADFDANFVAITKKVLEVENAEDWPEAVRKLSADRQFRYVCGEIGAYSGSSVLLYDGNGSGLRCRKEVEGALEIMKNDNRKVYVVQADCHY
jgi:hypothetical protein